jgi:hypothetical protein
MGIFLGVSLAVGVFAGLQSKQYEEIRHADARIQELVKQAEQRAEKSNRELSLSEQALERVNQRYAQLEAQVKQAEARLEALKSDSWVRRIEALQRDTVNQRTETIKSLRALEREVQTARGSVRSIQRLGNTGRSNRRVAFIRVADPHGKGVADRCRTGDLDLFADVRLSRRFYAYWLDDVLKDPSVLSLMERSGLQGASVVSSDVIGIDELPIVSCAIIKLTAAE